jgi:ATP:cob(I)alamin adenosyltransferase
MAELNRITTGAGDSGTSSLPGARDLPKDDIMFALLGDLDELQSVLGLARGERGIGDTAEATVERTGWIQKRIGELQKAVAGSLGRGVEGHAGSVVAEIETAQQRLAESTPISGEFVLPGANRASAALHLARTVCRRAERNCVSASRRYPDAGLHELFPALNRLSDYLFVLALSAASESARTETD